MLLASLGGHVMLPVGAAQRRADHGRAARWFRASCSGRAGPPIIVLFEQQCTGQADDRLLVRKGADDVAAPIDIAIEPFERIGAVQLGTARDQGVHMRHVRLRLFHQGGEFRDICPCLVGKSRATACGCSGGVLRESGADPGGDDVALRLARIGQGIAHEVNAAALHG